MVLSFVTTGERSGRGSIAFRFAARSGLSGLPGLKSATLAAGMPEAQVRLVLIRHFHGVGDELDHRAPRRLAIAKRIALTHLHWKQQGIGLGQHPAPGSLKSLDRERHVVDVDGEVLETEIAWSRRGALLGGAEFE